MMLLLKLFLAHCLGDFIFQPQSWVKEKEEKKWNSPLFYFHLITHGVIVIILLADPSCWALALVLMLVHGIIDLIKLQFQSETSRANWFFIDQTLHLLSLCVLWYFFSPQPIQLDLIQSTNVWVYAASLVFLTQVSSMLIQMMMLKWSSALNDESDDSLTNAGKWIGILERLFVFTFVVTENWEAIGFLLAAKSVFRFGDLKESKDRKLTEYILIGTLLSFGIALATGMLTRELLKTL